MKSMPSRICIVTTMGSSIENWVVPFLDAYAKAGIHVTVICNMEETYAQSLMVRYPHVQAVSIQIPRGIKLRGSFSSLWALYKIFRREQFDLVQYSTPNASFYAAVAAFLAGIKVRLYCQWGMVFVSASGLKRRLLRLMEKTICHLSTNIQPDSYGNLEYCRKDRLYSEKKSEVIWNGSAKGVDLSRYDFQLRSDYAQEIRHRYGIDQGDIVLGFVGRLGRDKGCQELFEAFQKLRQEEPRLKLLFVGPIEKEDTIAPLWLHYFYSEEAIIKTGRVADVEKHIAAMDIFVLPSYREGFGMSVVEAEAMGVPVVVTEYPGPVGGMVNGHTGYVIPIKDAQAIEAAVLRLIKNPEMCKRFGENGIALAREKFDSKVFCSKLMENRLGLIQTVRAE